MHIQVTDGLDVFGFVSDAFPGEKFTLEGGVTDEWYIIVPDEFKVTFHGNTVRQLRELHDVDGARELADVIIAMIEARRADSEV
jgi:hypothetical protein